MNKNFIDKDFLLDTPSARELYHAHAEAMPIIDYHCHLDPQVLAENRPLENIGQLWLSGDHYKWRAMRAHGIDERLITGNASWREKFDAWAETLPHTMRNPLYSWTHLELARAFGVDELLSPRTADQIWERCNEQLVNLRPLDIIEKFKVEAICTTDDPIDSLDNHRTLQSLTNLKVLPTWRADKALQIEQPQAYNQYIAQLEKATNRSINTFSELKEALADRHNYFGELGCTLSDHGLDTFYAEPYTDELIEHIFDRVRSSHTPTASQIAQFRSAMLYELAVMDHAKGWAQQFHIGPIRNNYPAMFDRLGADTGFDAIDDRQIAAAGHRFFGRLASEGRLARTVLYNLNPKDSAVLAAMATTFCEAPTPSKVQYGAAWWFLDTERGMTDQINTLSDSGLLSHFVGMLTDSRSLMSYPRHEYFRRTLCNIIGRDIESGRMPASEMEWIGSMVENISYHNAKKFLSI